MSELFEQYHCTVTRHDDGTFNIRQVDHSGNEEGVSLHISQIKYLAEVAGLLPAPAHIPEGADLVSCPLGGDGMHMLEVEASGGSIWLMQSRIEGMGGTDQGIELHPAQAAWLAARLRQIVGGPEDGREVATLKRRINKLHDKLLDLAAHYAREDVVSRSALGEYLIGDIDHAAELAGEFVEDMDDNDRVAAAVTPDRNVTGRNAMVTTSNAERQRRYRERRKQADLLTGLDASTPPKTGTPAG